MECSQELLDKYSLEHYTFINQIFGDATVRDIIATVFKNKKYDFLVEEVPENGLFERGYHHILVNKKKPDETLYCSVAERHQVPLKNIHDTLCQTYSLLKYLNKPLDDIFDNDRLSSREKMYFVHDRMIDMYKNLIKNKKFVDEFNTIDFINTKDENGKAVFRNYMLKSEPPLKMNSEKILKKIEELLDKWANYGYWHYIGTGKCYKDPCNKNRKIHNIKILTARINKKLEDEEI